MKKRGLALALALVLCLGLLPGSVWAAEDVPTVQVSFTAQAGGTFLCAPQLDTEVSGGLAESYGYDDGVKGGVSALDVLVRAHEVKYGEAFTSASASDYLVVEDGTVSKLFGTATASNGFMVNGGVPNNGVWNDTYGGYTGYTVDQAAVQNGDMVEFFIYQEEYSMDYATWFCREGVPVESFTAAAGSNVELVLEGIMIGWYGFEYIDGEEMHTQGGEPICGMQLAWVDVSTGVVTPIQDCLTSGEDGSVTVTMPEEPGVYYLSVDGTATDDMELPSIMSLTRVAVVGDMTVYVTVSDGGRIVDSKDGDAVAARAVTLTGKAGYTLDDVFRMVHSVYAIEGDTDYASAVGDYGLYVSKFWGKETGNVGYQVNHGTVSVMGAGDTVHEGDYVDAYLYQNDYPDSESYTTFQEYTATVAAGTPLELTLTQAGYDENWNTVFTPCEGAALTVDGVAQETVTDAQGKASVVFDRVGSYVVSARKTKVVNGETVTAITAPVCVVDVTAPDASFTVPSDATLFVGSKSKHFVPFTEIAPASRVENGGMTTYTYVLKTGSTYNFRVSGEGYVTYGGMFKKTDGFEKTVTQADLKPEGKTSATVERDVSANSGYNVADIYLNINPQGYLRLGSGETYQLVNLRNWEAVNTVSANYFIEPDYHYTVVDETGTASDVVTVSDSGLLTANKAGTAIVLVTYDAVQVESAEGGPFFGAVWPENTGVFVVSVDAPDSGIETGMTLNEGKNTVAETGKLALDALDAEHDVIYFIGETGSYTFAPKTAGCAVAVANPTVGERLRFTGFAPVEGNADGSVTVPLVQGRNIVKLTRDGKSTYQVVTAKQVTVSGIPEEAAPGQEIAITFDTLYHPANKLAGVYNMDAVAVYSDVDGYEGQLVGGTGNRHKFASTEEAQRVDSVLVRGTDKWGGLAYTKGASLTIPADWKEDTFTLRGGALYAYGYGDPFGNHRKITLTEGKAPNLNADVKEAYLGQLPDIVIPVKVSKPNPPAPPVSTDITVKFTLLGDEQHNSDVDKKVHTLKAGNLATWLEETAVTVEKGSTVFDVIDKALTDADIAYEEDGSENGYISAVNGLGETDNGENAGWMYTLNGKYPSKGIKQQGVRNGDKIVLHYTDDYTQEKTNIAPAKPADPSKPGAPSGTGTPAAPGQDKEAVAPKTTVKDGVAQGAVTTQEMAEAVKNAQKEEKSAVVITPAVEGDVNKVAVDIPVSAAAEAGLGVTVKTDLASVTVPGAALGELAKEAGAAVTVSAEAAENGGVKLAVAVDGKEMETVTGGIAVSVSAEELAPGSVLVIVGADGSQTVVKKSVAEDGGIAALLDGSATVKILDNSKKFDDVSADHWAKDAVAFVSSHELFQGTGDGTFQPGMNMDRGMVATVLYRLENGVVVGESTFADVDKDAWYADAVAWADACGIVTGDGAGFAPERAVTRQELAVMLYRLAKEDVKVTETADLTDFEDGNAVADWASEGMAWAVGVGLFQGKTGNVLDPAGVATRGEVAALMERLVRLMVK